MLAIISDNFSLTISSSICSNLWFFSSLINSFAAFAPTSAKIKFSSISSRAVSSSFLEVSALAIPEPMIEDVFDKPAPSLANQLLNT